MYKPYNSCSTTLCLINVPAKKPTGNGNDIRNACKYKPLSYLPEYQVQCYMLKYAAITDSSGYVTPVWDESRCGIYSQGGGKPKCVPC